MRIAIPLAQGKFSPHFGRCDKFAVFDIDSGANKVITGKVAAPLAMRPGPRQNGYMKTM